MIQSLDEFYNQLSNPLNDEYVLRDLMQIYQNELLIPTSVYDAVTNLYTHKSNTSPITEKDAFFSTIFNHWKHYIVNQNISNDDYLFPLKEHFQNIGDVYTWDEVIDSIPYEYQFDVVSLLSDSDYWIKVNSSRVHEQPRNGKYAPFDVEHRLYVNIEKEYVFELAKLFFDKCEEKQIPYNFKFTEDDRADSFVAYSDTEHLLDYYHILHDILKDNPQLSEHIHHPPIFTGTIDKKIGYGSELVKQNNSWASSFNTLRAQVFTDAMKEFEKSILLDYANYPLTKYYSKTVGDIFIDRVLKHSNPSTEISNHSLMKDELFKELSKDKQLKSCVLYFDGKPYSIDKSVMQDELKKLIPVIATTYPDVLGKMREKILEKAKDVSIDTNKFCCDQRLVSKFQNQKTNYSSYTFTDNNTIFSKNTNHDISEQKNISTNLNQGIYSFSKDEIIQDNLTPYPLTDNPYGSGMFDNNQNDSVYSMNQGIIQDLPIYSNEETRYSGNMSDEEILESQNKISSRKK